MKPIILSRMQRSDPRRTVSDYLVSRIRNAEPQGLFYRKTRYVRWLPGKLLLSLMVKAFKYDSILFEREGRIIGNISFQRHGNALHVFGTEIEPAYRSPQVVAEGIRHLIEYARSVPGITHLRIGGIKHPTGSRLYGIIKRSERQLGIKAQEDGWVELCERK